jgi:hypothetical protein
LSDSLKIAAAGDLCSRISAADTALLELIIANRGIVERIGLRK